MMNVRDTEEYKKYGYQIVTCPVCGAETLDTYFICKRCDWEYDGVTGEDEYSDANSATVSQYRAKVRDRVRTVAVFSPDPAMTTALQQSGVTYWEKKGRLIVLNCALADAVVFGRSNKGGNFLWGKSGETMGRYCIGADGICPPEDTGEKIDPMDYCAKAPVVRDPEAFVESLNESRTFLSRAKHRRTAHR